MEKVKAFRVASSASLEAEINTFLEGISDQELIDIKFSTTYNDSSVIHSTWISYSDLWS